MDLSIFPDCCIRAWRFCHGKIIVEVFSFAIPIWWRFHISAYSSTLRYISTTEKTDKEFRHNLLVQTLAMKNKVLKIALPNWVPGPSLLSFPDGSITDKKFLIFLQNLLALLICVYLSPGQNPMKSVSDSTSRGIGPESSSNLMSSDWILFREL